MPIEQMVDIGRVAEFLGVSTRTVMRYVAEKKIPNHTNSIAALTGGDCLT